MPSGFRFHRRIASALLFLAISATPAIAQDRLCDPAELDEYGRDCRDILITHIRAEQVGLDVAFWFMEDAWIASEVINRWKAGVPVRILMDTEANLTTPRNITRLAEFEAAGIPMREKVSSGILHWKMMLFAGQGIVQFSGANYSSDAWTFSGAEYTNYTDEVIYFAAKPSIVNSFRTKFDDLWVNTTDYSHYRNITTPPARVYGTYPIDPELNFVPLEYHAPRALAAYAEETRKIDVTMYRITDSQYADAMIAAVNRGVPVRLLTEPLQYRDPIRQYHSWNIDRMFMAGVEIRHRAHPGLNHQKSVTLYDRGLSVFGSSNWSSASSYSQEEHNLFTQDPVVFQWIVDQFERKWNNTAGQVESAPFTPLPPGQPTSPGPGADEFGVDPAAVRLTWNGGYWAHRYDVYLGSDLSNMVLVGSVGRATSNLDYNGLTLSAPLSPGTRYYWRVVGKTMANQASESPLWTFTTAGTTPPPPPPPTSTITLTRQPYLQQVTSTGGVIVWATREPGNGEVRLTTPSGTRLTVTATRTLYPATSTGLAADYYQYAAPLTGLSAATSYTYDIIVAGEDLNPVTDTMTTAPASSASRVTFVTFGDSGTGSTGQGQIASLLAGDSFDFAMHGGDIAYANTSGTGPASYQTMDGWFFSPYSSWLRNRPIFPSMGNHDSRATNADGRPYLDLFVLPTQAATTEYPDHAERYYSFDYGPVHVIVLDTEFAFQDPARRAAQLAWAEADLAATTQPWRIALYHRSAYSAGGENGSELPVRAAFGPLFDRHNVHLALSAHEHDYERTLPLRAGESDPSGTTYVVTGGGGGPLYPSGSAAWTAYSASVHHYVRGSATECTLTLDAIGVDGVIFDSVTLQQCTPPADTDAPVVSITAPTEGASLQGVVNVSATATDNVRVAAVELLVDNVVVMTDTQAPFTFAWDSTTVTDGLHTLTVRATDAAGNAATSAPVTATVANPAAGEGDIVLYTGDATTLHGRWQKENDPTAAGGVKLRNPDAGGAKRVVALAVPTDYFEMTFNAVPNVPYRFWMRGKADGDVYSNDSVFVQFTGATDYAIGTTSATEYNLEDCSGCRIAGWGWQDNAWGVGVPSTPIVFTTAGPITMRIQTREDGLSIDQIVFSPDRFFSTSPGTLKNDTTIYPRSTGATPDPDPDPVPEPNVAPTVSLTGPAAGASYTAPATIQLTAAAADSDGTVARVDFFAGTQLVGSATASPYAATWSGVAAGSYTVTAVATDDAGATTTSASVTVTVREPDPDPEPEPNVAPTVTVTGPATGASYTAPATIQLTAAAADSDGTVARVDFFAGTQLVGSATASPYAATWSGVAAGSYTVTAVATDDAGATTTSASVTVTVREPDPDPEPEPNVAPTVSLTGPAAGASYTAPATIQLTAAAADSDGTVVRVDFFAGTQLVGSATASPYAATWSGVAAGSYTVTAVATDDAGATTTSASVAVTVREPEPDPDPEPEPNVAPTVTVTGPATGASYTAPATIQLTAAAADSDGTVARVDFFAGTQLVGSATASPYAATWSGVAAGSYTVTAVATDDAGATTTSASVAVTVATAPVDPPPVPASWTSQDIGAVGAAGSFSMNNEVFTVTGAGADIWNRADAFQYVWQPLTGDADVVARVTSVEYVHAWVKAGVMIREHLTPESPQALMLVSPGKGLAFQRRVASGGVSTSTTGGAGTAPAWVKLERRGNTITAYRSADGVVWTLVGTDTFSMAADVFVGIVVSSHVSGRLAAATFDHVSVTPPAAPEPPGNPNEGNVTPTVSLTQPATGASFIAPALITLAAAAADSDGSIVRVDFYAGAYLVGTDTVGPFTVDWSGVAAGAYTLTARATDDAGATATSAPVTITVEAPPPPPPTLPAPWTSQDIGAVGAAGTASATSGVFSVTGAGADIWNTADAFQYVWQPLTGDADIIARVTSIEYVHAWVKAGVMIRERLDASSAHALMLVSPGKGVAFQRRRTTADISTSTSGGAGTAPEWVKLERRGNTITAFRSPDGVSWTLVGADTFTMAADVFVGIVVSSHVNGRLATATFEQVRIVPR